MDNNEYLKFELKFLPPAMAKMRAIRQILNDVYRVPTTEIDAIDHDDERGIGFGVLPDHQNRCEAWVELMLTDGADRGWSGCGVLMQCSHQQSGILFAPNNYTDHVGTTDPQEIARRVQEIDAPLAAQDVVDRWTELGLLNAAVLA